jgi:hypothetical protein
VNVPADEGSMKERTASQNLSQVGVAAWSIRQERWPASDLCKIIPPG